MSEFDQTRDNFLEALIEIMQRFYDGLKMKHEGKDVDKDGKNDLSDNAKDLLKTLKQDPELTKNLIQQYATEKLDQNIDKVKEINDKILTQLSDLKKDINLDTPEGKERFDKIEKLEQIQLDKEMNVKEKIYKLLVHASENKNEHESKSALSLAEKLMNKYDLNKEDVLENNMLKENERDKKETVLIETSKSEKVVSGISTSTNNEQEEPVEVSIRKENQFRQESIYVEQEPKENENKTNWQIENRTVKNVKETESSEIPTSIKLKKLEEKGIDISKLHSRTSVNREYESMIEREKTDGENYKETKTVKDKVIHKEEVEIER